MIDRMWKTRPGTMSALGLTAALLVAVGLAVGVYYMAIALGAYYAVALILDFETAYFVYYFFSRKVLRRYHREVQ